MGFRFGLSALSDCGTAYVVGSSNSQHPAVGICNHRPSKSTQGSPNCCSIGQEVGNKLQSMAVFVLYLIRWFYERRSKLSSLVHSFALCIEYASIAIENGFARRQIHPVLPQSR